jgi:hypothetical protein
MRYYVFASKPGTESLIGRGEISFVSPTQDLATALGEWLMRRGWTVRLSDSSERSEPVNGAQAAAVVGFLVKQFAEEVQV